MGWAPQYNIAFDCRVDPSVAGRNAVRRLQITDRVGAQLDQIWTFSALDQERALSSAPKSLEMFFSSRMHREKPRVVFIRL